MIQNGRVAGAVALAVLAGTALAGCGQGGQSAVGTDPAPCLAPDKPVAVAIGARSNSPAPVLGATVTSLLTSAVDGGKTITLVRIDGRPAVVFSQAVTPGANTQLTNQARNEFVAQLHRALAGTPQSATDIRARAPQADVLDAIADAASDVPAGGDVIVMDSGLQTVEPLDFRTGLLTDDPALIVSYLKQADELPDLTGRNIYFVGLGWTAPPQPSLSISDRSKVVQIWAQIARAAGASCVGTDNASNTGASVRGRPPVAVVPLPPPPLPIKPCSVISLGDRNHVGFVFNSTVFRDPAGAHATLSKLAGLMLRTGESVTLTGSTSSEGSNQHNYALSRRRADAVRSVLRQLGVPASRITTVGDGSHLPGRLNDRGPDGQLLIGPAIQDRKVVARLAGPKCRTS